MAKFADSSGNAWTIALTTWTAKRVRSETGVDLFDGDRIFRLASDYVTLADVLFAMVEPQAKAAGISAESFGNALRGPCIRDAVNALLEAYVDFSPSPEQAANLRRAMELLARTEAEAHRRATVALGAADPATLLDRIAPTSGATSTRLPGSSESIPAR